MPRQGWRIGVPRGGAWREGVNTDAEAYGGTNSGNGGLLTAQPVASHGYEHSLELLLPPLATLILMPQE